MVEFSNKKLDYFETNITSGTPNKPVTDEEKLPPTKPIFTSNQGEGDGPADVLDIYGIQPPNISSEVLCAYDESNCIPDKIRMEKLTAYQKYRAIIDNLVKTKGVTEEQAKEMIKKQTLGEGMERMSATLKALNYDATKVDWNNVRELKSDELNEAISIIGKTIPVHGGMTRTEAEKIGGEPLKYFNAICKEGQDKISETDILCYKQAQLEEKGIKIENIIKTYNKSDKVTQMKIVSGLIGTVSDPENIREEFRDIKDIDGFVKTLGIYDDWEKAKTPEEKGKLLGEAFLKIVKNDLNFDDMNSRIYKEIDAIAAGDFNKDEIAKGYSKDSQLTPAEIQQLAINRITKEYMSTIAHLCDTAFNGVDDTQKSAVVHSLFESLEQAPMIRQILQAWGIGSMTEGSEEQQNATKAVAQYETEHDEFDASSLSGSMITSAIIRYGDEQTVSDFIINNSNQVNAITNVANDTINSMPDGEKKSSLSATVANAVNVAKIYNESTLQTVTDSNRAENGARVEQSDYQNKPATNPISNIKELSERWHNKNNNKTPQQIKRERLQAELEKQHKEMRTKMRIKIAGIKNKPPEVALEIMCSHFDQMPEHVKTFFLNGLSRMKNSHHDMFCEAYLKGCEKLRQFLDKQHVISDSDICYHLDSHPEDLVYANKTMTAKYYEYRSKLLLSGLDNRPNNKIKDNWHDYYGLSQDKL